MSAYEELLTRLKDIDLIRQIGGLLSWDQEVMMPPKAAPLRAEQLAWISKSAHERITDAKIGEILDELESSNDLDAIKMANIRLHQINRLPQLLCTDSIHIFWEEFPPQRD